MAQAAAAQQEPLLDNELVRVTRWTLRPGTVIAWHRHELPYLVVPVEGGRLIFRDKKAETPAEVVAGTPIYRPAGIEHDVRNPGDSTVVFVEIELRS